MSNNKTYGLHPSYWRKYRAKQGGTIEHEALGYSGKVIGSVIFYRYESLVIVDCLFNAIDWTNTINRLKTDKSSRSNGFIGGDNITCCHNTYM